MRRFLYIIIVLSATSAFAQKLTVGQFFSKEESAFVTGGGIISAVHLKYSEDLFSDSRFSSSIALPETEYYDSSLNTREMVSYEKGFIPYDLNEASRLSFYNALQSYTLMAGMKYYSHKAKEVQPFILKSYRIASPDKPDRIDDDKSQSIEKHKTAFFTMTDNKFGELVFRSELFSEGDNFVLRNVCVHPVKKYGVKISESEEYTMISYFIYDRRYRGYYYISANSIRIRSDFFLRMNPVSPKSFGNRLRAGTVQLVKGLGIDWSGRIKAFE